MARKVQVILSDDLDDSVSADETVTFALDGEPGRTRRAGAAPSQADRQVAPSRGSPRACEG